MVRNYILVLWIGVLSVSCSQNIDRLTSNLQAVVQGDNLFRANDLQAGFLDDGSLQIIGSSGIQRIVFIITDFQQSEITLGGVNHGRNVAQYQTASGLFHTTDNPEANGQLSLRINADNSVSGEFNFTAIRDDNVNDITLNRGFIFRIPISDLEDPVDPVDPIIVDDDFTATVNTIPFDPTVFTSLVNDGQLLVSAQTSLAVITLNFPVDTMPGTYVMVEGTPIFGTYFVAEETSVSSMGELIITLNESNVVMGSFDFTTTSGFNIIGEFTINY